VERRRNRRPPRLVAAAVLVACLLAPGAARADAPPLGADAPAARDDDARAAAAFAEGERAFDAGDYRAAAEAFEAAYRVRPHHAPLWNAARSWQSAGDEVRAANLLERYLREAPESAPDRSRATALLGEIGQRLARIQVLQPIGVIDVRIDDAPLEESTRYVAPGEHVTTARANGKAIVRSLTVRAGEIVSVLLAPPAEPPPPPPPAPRAPEGTSRRASPLVVLVAGALTAVGVGLTVASGVDTVHKRDAFLDDPTQRRLDDAFASQTRTNVALGVTAGAAVFTGVMAAFFVDWKGR